MKGNKRGWFRSGLVVFQFTIAIIIVICTIVIYTQLTFIQNKNLGFDKEHVLIVERAYGLEKQTEAFKYELLKHSCMAGRMVADAKLAAKFCL